MEKLSIACKCDCDEKMISRAETSVTAMDPRARSETVRSINIRGESIHRQETGGLRSAVRISGIDYREEKPSRKYPGTVRIMLKSERPERGERISFKCR